MAGRHLQHGDEAQPTRNGEVFMNCSTAAFSFLKKYLLLNGSGVGRSYADALMLVDWNLQPKVITTIGTIPPCEDIDGTFLHSGEFLTPDSIHPEAGSFPTINDAWTIYPDAVVFRVPDTREGWAKAIEKIEWHTYLGRSDVTLIIDFSAVRPAGAPIGGMQDRPSSGPLPLMEAINKINAIKDAGIPQRWRQTMFVDHYLAEVVLVGGARRSARIAVKPWTDPEILDFIHIKEEGGLWSANNSVGVDAEFWEALSYYEAQRDSENFEFTTPNKVWQAKRIFDEVMNAQYLHGSGEPGFINLDKLAQNDEGMDVYDDGDFANGTRYQLDPETNAMGRELISQLSRMKYKMIVNPCGEIPLLAIGGYCCLGSFSPYFCDSLVEILQAAKATARALVRANTMDFLYNKEVKRTNRIGLTMVGIHEWAWKTFKLSFRDILDETGKGRRFWSTVATIRDVVVQEVERYCKENGWTVPHTMFTMQPAGTIAKLFGLTEAAHLAALREYLRWVQFKNSDPLVDIYATKGYPVIREIVKQDGTVAYEGMSIVGFPTEPLICRLMPPELVVTAAEATIEEQFQWLRLLEKYWLGEKYGNQVSYTLKYNRADVDLATYTETMKRWLPQVRCVSVMAPDDWKRTVELYGYSPEEPITRAEYESMRKHIDEKNGPALVEDVDMAIIACQNGACPL
jgi:adenosylcobalamin-dependent ribonucleoside-triphosphate reductase